MEATPQGPREQRIEIKRDDIFQYLRNNSSGAFGSEVQKRELFNFIVTSQNALSADHLAIKIAIAEFLKQAQRKWNDAHRICARFRKKNKLWLEGNLIINTKHDKAPAPAVQGRKRGRPCKPFEESSERSKRRKTSELRQTQDLQKIQFAAQMKLREQGKSDAAKVVKDITSTPTRGSKYRQGFAKRNLTLPHIPVEKALAMIMDAGLSKNQYEIIKSVAKESGCDVFPSYYKIKDEKAKSHPANIETTETKGEVKLQELLDHTTQRIIQSLEEPLAMQDFENREFVLTSKWGCDGTHGSIYKQRFENENNTDEYVFLTSFVPLQLSTKHDNRIIWRNPRPSSTRFCRPIRLQFAKETAAFTLQEKTYIENQINNLVPTNIRDISVSHNMIFSMIDGKVCNAVTHTNSTQRCYICSLTSTNFNKLKLVKNTPVNEETLKFGLSTLHAWIRMFENLIHVSYKLTIKKGQTKDPTEKLEIMNRKKNIQTEFKKMLGLIVDKPKQSYGNSNDGNTARRFFENSQISSQITGIDVNLIKKIHIILQALSCGISINIEAFEKYASETAHLYVELYGWYPMSTTMHKILMHSATVIKYCNLPIGMLSEEAQESRNKDVRNYREHFARKCSRIRNMEDVIKRLLISSDPFLSNQIKFKRSTKKYSQELLGLLQETIC